MPAFDKNSMVSDSRLGTSGVTAKSSSSSSSTTTYLGSKTPGGVTVQTSAVTSSGIANTSKNAEVVDWKTGELKDVNVTTVSVVPDYKDSVGNTKTYTVNTKTTDNVTGKTTSSVDYTIAYAGISAKDLAAYNAKKAASLTASGGKSELTGYDFGAAATALNAIDTYEATMTDTEKAVLNATQYYSNNATHTNAIAYNSDGTGYLLGEGLTARVVSQTVTPKTAAVSDDTVPTASSTTTPKYTGNTSGSATPNPKNISNLPGGDIGEEPYDTLPGFPSSGIGRTGQPANIGRTGQPANIGRTDIDALPVSQVASEETSVTDTLKSYALPAGIAATLIIAAVVFSRTKPQRKTRSKATKA